VGGGMICGWARRCGGVLGAAALATLAALTLAGCGGDTAPGSATSGSTGPEPSTTVKPELPVYKEGAPRPIGAGSYVTGSNGFFSGLQLTIPPGWSATETDQGEIGLHPDARPDDALLLWKDMAAVVTHNRNKKVGHVRPDVGRSAEDLLDWLTTTSDFSVLSKPASVTYGPSITGTQLTIGVSETANFAWDDCPDNPRCAAILTDPEHWGTNFYAIGGDEVSRIFIGTVHYPEGDHTLFITLDTPNQDELATFARQAEPIIRSLRVPSRYTDN